jgi:hypothetical protein
MPLQRYWIDGQQVELTPRQELRLVLRAGYSMNYVETMQHRGGISPAAYDRFLRLWIWGTATMHNRTQNVPLERWSKRRNRVRNAINTVLAA